TGTGLPMSWPEQPLGHLSGRRSFISTRNTGKFRCSPLSVRTSTELNFLSRGDQRLNPRLNRNTRRRIRGADLASESPRFLFKGANGELGAAATVEKIVAHSLLKTSTSLTL